MRKTTLCPQCHGIGWLFEDQAAAASAEVDALRAKVATLEAQLAAVTPWEIVGRVPTEEERSDAPGWIMASDDGVQLVRYADYWRSAHGGYKIDVGYIKSCHPRFIALGPDGRPMPKPAHIP